MHGIDELGYLLERACRTSSAMKPRTPSRRPRCASPHLRHDAARRHAARGPEPLGGRQDPHRAAARRARGRASSSSGGRAPTPRTPRSSSARATSSGASASLAAFGSTRKAGLRARRTIRRSPRSSRRGAPVCTIFGKASLLHVREVLRISAEENLRMIAETVRLPRRERAPRRVRRRALLRRLPRGRRVSRWRRCGPRRAPAPRRSSSATPTAGRSRGRSRSASPRWSRRSARPVGIHAHDDAGCGVANSIAAVRAGATHVQGTINGYGERCGNANLCSIVPNLELKMGKRCLARGRARGADARRLAGRRDREPGAGRARGRTSAGARSRTRAACTSRRSAGTRAPTSTSTRRSSATGRASW